MNAHLYSIDGLSFRNAEVEAARVAIINNVDSIMEMVVRGRDGVQDMLALATEAYAIDNGEEGAMPLVNHVWRAARNTGALPVTAIQRYILWLFETGPIQYNEEGDVVVVGDSALRYIGDEGKPGEQHTFQHRKEKKEGEKKRVAVAIDLLSVKARLKAHKWYDFNPSKPSAPYKGKLAAAIKADTKAMKEGKYQPDATTATFLKEVEALMAKHGLNG